MLDREMHRSCHLSLLCALVAYGPLVGVVGILLWTRGDMGYLPQYAFAWTLLWSTAGLLLGHAPLAKNMKSARVGVFLCSFPVAAFLGFVFVSLLLRGLFLLLDLCR